MFRFRRKRAEKTRATEQKAINYGIVTISGKRSVKAGRVHVVMESVEDGLFEFTLPRSELIHFDWLNNVRDDSGRGTGRTIAAQLETIAFALRRPNQWVAFMVDQGPVETMEEAEDWLVMIREKVIELNLNFLDSRIHNGIPEIRFNWDRSPMDTQSRGWRTICDEA